MTPYNINKLVYSIILIYYYRLEQAVDSNDIEVAAWALENEDFQRLVEGVDIKTGEDRKLQKLLHRTSKEIYKLRKTRLGKGQPDVVSFK